MARNMRGVTFLSILIIILFEITGCQPTPKAILHTANSSKTLATAVINPTATSLYRVSPSGIQPEPAKEDKEVQALVPTTQKRIQQAVTIQGRKIILDASASIPNLTSVPILQAEYIPPLDNQTMQKIAALQFADQTKARLLSNGEVESKNYNPDYYKLVTGESKFCMSTTKQNTFSVHSLTTYATNQQTASTTALAVKGLQSKLNNIYQEVDVWPDPIISDGEQFVFMQCLWGLPLAYNNAYVDGIVADGSAWLEGTIASEDETIDGGAWGDMKYKKGQIITYSVSTPMRIVGVKNQSAVIEPLDNILEYIARDNHANKFLKPGGVEKIDLVHMIYVPIADGSGYILKPYWEFGGKESVGNALCLYRYSALAEDYSK